MRASSVLLLTAGAIIALACSRRDAQSTRDTTGRSQSAPHQTALLVVADTDVVRSQGVPAAPDDTESTEYNKHQTPRRLSSPACRPEGIAMCVVDTATRVHSVDCCMSDQRQTSWLVFAAAHDSLQLFMEPASDAYIAMSPRNAAGASAETSTGVDASWLRARFPVAGAYVFTASIESDSPAPYELRIAPVIATGASQPNGAVAALTLTGSKAEKIVVVPHSMTPAPDADALRKFAVPPGTYRVLLVRDTLYTVCVLPCTRRTAVTLKQGQAITVSP